MKRFKSALLCVPLGLGVGTVSMQSAGAETPAPAPEEQGLDAASAARELHETQNDKRIAAQVREALTNDAEGRVDALSVSVQGGIVTLQGSVETVEQKDLAGGQVGALDGVEGVVNAIQVVPPASRRGEQAPTTE